MAETACKAGSVSVARKARPRREARVRPKNVIVSKNLNL